MTQLYVILGKKNDSEFSIANNYARSSISETKRLIEMMKSNDIYNEWEFKIEKMEFNSKSIEKVLQHTFRILNS